MENFAIDIGNKQAEIDAEQQALLDTLSSALSSALSNALSNHLSRLRDLSLELVLLRARQERTTQMSADEIREENLRIFPLNQTLKVIPSLNSTVLPVQITTLHHINSLTLAEARIFLQAYELVDVPTGNGGVMKRAIAKFLGVAAAFRNTIH